MRKISCRKTQQNNKELYGILPTHNTALAVPFLQNSGKLSTKRLQNDQIMKQYTTATWDGKLILLATILASGMAFLDGSIVNIAIPTIQDVFGATIGQIQWVINAYSLILGSLMLISGALGDRLGRKKVFMTGIVLFTLSSLLCSFAPSILFLIVSRGLQGVGAALMTPGSLSIINSSFAHSVRGRAIGLWSGCAGGLAALGPFLGGYLVQTYGWPSIFYINLPIGILTLYIAWRYVPEMNRQKSKKLDLAGAACIFFGLFGIIYGLIQGPEQGWNNPGVLLSLIAGIVFLTAFVIVEKHVSDPLLRFEIFTSSLVKGANWATLFLYFALSGVIFFLVLNFQQVQHYSPLFAGMGLLPTILLITFLSGYGGTLADRLGPRIPMIVGPLIVAVGMASFILPGRQANYFTAFFPGLILFGLGMSLVIAPLTKSALSVEEHYSGIASGFNNAVSRIAGLLAIALLGALVLSIFSARVASALPVSSLRPEHQVVIAQQMDKLGGIQIPDTFSEQEKQEAQAIIEESFIKGFRIAMGINTFLAVLSAVVSYIFIHTKNPLRS